MRTFIKSSYCLTDHKDIVRFNSNNSKSRPGYGGPNSGGKTARKSLRVTARSSAERGMNISRLPRLIRAKVPTGRVNGKVYYITGPYRPAKKDRAAFNYMFRKRYITNYTHYIENHVDNQNMWNANNHLISETLANKYWINRENGRLYETATINALPNTSTTNSARALATAVSGGSSGGNSGISVKAYNPTFQSHPFHMVENSPWPLIISLSLMALAINAVMYFWGYKNPFGDTGSIMLLVSMLCTVMIIGLWFRDVIVEGTMLGDHTARVKESLTLGFGLFVVSEVFFFISIFWAYLHSSLSPTVELGAHWPPQGVSAINPFELPLRNTLLRLSSGAALTFSHHGLLNIARKPAVYGLVVTLVLALLFTACQGVEYYNAEFTFSDGVYGSTFYMATGFHGIHVIIGTIFLAVTSARLINYHLTDGHHVGYESSAVYWHFVDVVWLGLYILVYWWGS